VYYKYRLGRRPGTPAFLTRTSLAGIAARPVPTEGGDSGVPAPNVRYIQTYTSASHVLGSRCGLSGGPRARRNLSAPPHCPERFLPLQGGPERQDTRFCHPGRVSLPPLPYRDRAQWASALGRGMTSYYLRSIVSCWRMDEENNSSCTRDKSVAASSRANIS
jgi:hypothetical protein